MISLIPLFVVWFLVLLYGGVYLLVDSELLERCRKWFTSVVTYPEDAEIAAALGEEVIDVPPVVKAGKLRVFVGKVLSCWMCTAGWVSLPAAALIVAIALSLHFQIWWLLGILSFFIIPPTGIGFVALVDHMSPKRASESIVSAMTDIAQVVLSSSQDKIVDERHLPPGQQQVVLTSQDKIQKDAKPPIAKQQVVLTSQDKIQQGILTPPPNGKVVLTPPAGSEVVLTPPKPKEKA